MVMNDRKRWGKGETIERVEQALKAQLDKEGVLTFLIEECVVDMRALAIAALRALIEQDGRFDVPAELIILGGKEPGSVQSMFDVTIGGVLRNAGVATAKYDRPKLEPESDADEPTD